MRVLGCVGLLACAVFGQERIESFHAEIVVQRSGALEVIETIEVQSDGVSIRHGIYRDVPTRKGEWWFRVRELQVIRVFRGMEEEPYEIEELPDGIRIRIGSERTVLRRGLHVYRIVYTIKRQLHEANDVAKLHWNVTGNYWEFPIQRAAARVLLPAVPLKTNAYTGALGDHGSRFRMSRYKNSVLLETTAPLPPGHGLTVVATWPSGLVRISDDWTWDDNRDLQVGLLGVAGLFVYLVVAWFMVGRDRVANVGVRRTPPPDLTPAGARFVTQVGLDDRCFVAALLDLEDRGVLALEENDGDWIVEARDLTIDLPEPERRLVDVLLSEGARVRLRDEPDRVESASHELGQGLEKSYSAATFDFNYKAMSYMVFAAIVLIPAIIWSAPEGTRSKLIMVSVAVVLIGGFGDRLLHAALTHQWHVRHAVAWRRPTTLYLAAAAAVALAVFMASSYQTHGSALVPLCIFAIVALNAWGFRLLRTPTWGGRRRLEHLQGFATFLGRGGPAAGAYYPYAVALDMHEGWDIDLGPDDPPQRLRRYRAIDISSMQASVSPPSRAGGSGGSGGGYSGGGRGGGGGGGW